MSNASSVSPFDSPSHTPLGRLLERLREVFSPRSVDEAISQQHRKATTTFRHGKCVQFLADSGIAGMESASLDNVTCPTIAEELLVAGHNWRTDSHADYQGILLRQLHPLAVRRGGMNPEIKARVLFQIRVLESNPLAGRHHAKELVPYLDISDFQVKAAVRNALVTLVDRPERTTSQIVPARIEWIDGDIAVVRFEHPKLGVVEREFDKRALPKGSEAGDTFDLAIERDAHDRVSGYSPRRDRLEKCVPAEWEMIPKPSAPKDLDDLEEMARYDQAMSHYMSQTTEIRARDAAQWRDGRKKA